LNLGPACRGSNLNFDWIQSMRVMVVDDSVVFRSQLKNCLDGEEGISVVATAANGKIALDRLEKESCDLIILDLEMPEMNGLEFLEEFRRRKHTQRVIIFAAPTKEGASQLLASLKAGASDFIAKPTTAISLQDALEGIKRDLLPKILQFKKRHEGSNERSMEGHKDNQKDSHVLKQGLGTPASSPNRVSPYKSILLETFKPQIVVVGSSTGGPMALEKLFSVLKGRTLLVPILIAQHMPPYFTEALAKRIEGISGIPSGEGKPGEPILPGRIYMAPGDYHMSIHRLPEGAKPVIKIDQSAKRNSVRPAVDYLFESAAREYGAACAGFVLTGMGEDGKDGSMAIKKANGAIMIQDKESSVVWGMPGSVFETGAFDREGNLDQCSQMLVNMVC